MNARENGATPAVDAGGPTAGADASDATASADALRTAEAIESPAGVPPSPEELRGELDTLRDSLPGPQVEPEVGFVRALLDAAERLGGGARQLLLHRANRALAALRQRVDLLRREADAQLSALRAAGLDVGGVLGAARDRGDLHRLSRATRRWRRRLSRPRARAGAPSTAAPAVNAGSTAPSRDPAGAPAAPPPAAPPRAVPGSEEQCEAADQYRATAGTLRAMLALDRALAGMPEGLGAYNSERVAAALLRRMAETSLLYLSTQLDRLDDLAELAALPLPEPPPPPRKEKKKEKKAGRARR
jgi:hypothetical protein